MRSLTRLFRFFTPLWVAIVGLVVACGGGGDQPQSRAVSVDDTPNELPTDDLGEDEDAIGPNELGNVLEQPSAKDTPSIDDTVEEEGDRLNLAHPGECVSASYRLPVLDPPLSRSTEVLALSRDSRHVVVASDRMTWLVDLGTNETWEIYPGALSMQGQLSDDGRFYAFRSGALDVPGAQDTTPTTGLQGVSDTTNIYLFDREAGTSKQITDGAGFMQPFSLTPDGSILTVGTIDPGLADGVLDAPRDPVNGVKNRVVRYYVGEDRYEEAASPDVELDLASDDGEVIVFASRDAGGAEVDGDRTDDLYMFRWSTGEIELLYDNGPGSGPVTLGINGDGSAVLFTAHLVNIDETRIIDTSTKDSYPSFPPASDFEAVTAGCVAYTETSEDTGLDPVVVVYGNQTIDELYEIATEGATSIGIPEDGSENLGNPQLSCDSAELAASGVEPGAEAAGTAIEVVEASACEGRFGVVSWRAADGSCGTSIIHPENALKWDLVFTVDYWSEYAALVEQNGLPDDLLQSLISYLPERYDC